MDVETRLSSDQLFITLGFLKKDENAIRGIITLAESKRKRDRSLTSDTKRLAEDLLIVNISEQRRVEGKLKKLGVRYW